VGALGEHRSRGATEHSEEGTSVRVYGDGCVEAGDLAVGKWVGEWTGEREG